MISAFVGDPGQLDDAAYSSSYFVGGIRAVVPTTDTATLELQAPWNWARDRRLGVEYGSAGDVLTRQWARRVGGVTTQLYPTAAEALAGLQAGEVRAVLVDAVTASAFVSGSSGYVLTGPTLDPEPYVIATGARSPRLLDEVNRLLAELEQDGTLPALRQRFLGVAAKEGLRLQPRRSRAADRHLNRSRKRLAVEEGGERARAARMSPHGGVLGINAVGQGAAVPVRVDGAVAVVAAQRDHAHARNQQALAGGDADRQVACPGIGRSHRSGFTTL